MGGVCAPLGLYHGTRQSTVASAERISGGGKPHCANPLALLEP
jgi:hypothetical protein